MAPVLEELKLGLAAVLHDEILIAVSVEVRGDEAPAVRSGGEAVRERALLELAVSELVEELLRLVAGERLLVGDVQVGVVVFDRLAPVQL
ncbi:MAG: hypothetical protein ACJ790_16250 [Myxococcaceae bacterium]